jgi:hypothetical protein
MDYLSTDVFEWLIALEPYPLISRIDTILDIFLKGAKRGSTNGKEEIDP